MATAPVAHQPEPGGCELTAHQRADVIYLLIRTGSFDPTDAAIYADGWRCRPAPELVLQEAIRYDDLGLTPTQAVAWHQAGVYAAETGTWLSAGYKPDQAAALVLLVSFADLDGWLDSGIPPARALALARAGVSPWEADQVLHDAAMTPATLPMMAALLER